MGRRQEHHSRLRLTTEGYHRVSLHFPPHLRGYALYGHVARMGNALLNQQTVCRILERQQPVTYYSLDSLFSKFGLDMGEADYEPFPATRRASQRHHFFPHELSRCFIGRQQELQALRSLLVRNRVVSISGLGGIGKTQLALAYCENHKDLYDAIFWLRVQSDSEVVQGYAEIARHLSLAGASASEAQLAQAAMRWLEQHSDWLLVVDNLDMPEQGTTYFPTRARGHILVTTRRTPLNLPDVAASLPLNTLSSEEAIEFFLRRCQRENAPPAERAAAAELAERLGCLPLALEQAGAYIANMTTFTNYLALYKRRQLAQLSRSAPTLGEYATPLSAAWEISFQSIEREAQRLRGAGMHALALLNFCAFLAPDAIPLELIKIGSPEYCPGLDACFQQAEDEAEVEEVYNEVLEPLTRYSLITKNLESRAFSLHRLVQAVTQDRLEDRKRTWQERVVCAVDRAFPFPLVQNWQLCERLQPHAVAVGEVIRQERITTQAAGRLLYHLGDFMMGQGRYAHAETYARHGLGIREHFAEENPLDVAASLHSLGNMLHHQNKYAEAQEALERALEIFQRHLPPNDPDLIHLLNDQAAVYNSQGLYPLAERIYLQLLAFAEAAFAENAEETVANSIAYLCHNLGWSYYGQGRYEEALQWYRKALEHWERVPIRNHPQHAGSWHELGKTYRKMGRVEAEACYFKALEMQEAAYPQGHPDIGITLYNIADFYKDAARYKQAEEYFVKARDMDAKTFGEISADVLADLKALVELYTLIDRSEDASAIQRQAEIIAQQLAVENSPEA